MRAFLPTVALGLLLPQQTPLAIARDGWEAFPGVVYVGGDSGMPLKRQTGMLVLTDSTLTLYQCRWEVCQDDQKRGPWKGAALWSTPLRAVTAVKAVPYARAEVRYLNGAALDESIVFTVERNGTAEAPIFAVRTTVSDAVVAKVEVRRRKAAR